MDLNKGASGSYLVRQLYPSVFKHLEIQHIYNHGAEFRRQLTLNVPEVAPSRSQAFVQAGSTFLVSLHVPVITCC